jgi:hypothetical protein
MSLNSDNDDDDDNTASIALWMSFFYMLLLCEKKIWSMHDLLAHSANIDRFLSLSLSFARLFDPVNDWNNVTPLSLWIWFHAVICSLDRSVGRKFFFVFRLHVRGTELRQKTENKITFKCDKQWQYTLMVAFEPQNKERKRERACWRTCIIDCLLPRKHVCAAWENDFV